jgi:HAE1 family hydrophobic/amphiphilic exporter-1
MMCSRLLKAETKEHGWLYRVLERGFDAILAGYERTLKVALRHRFATLMVMLGTIVATGYLYYVVPKGFFPQQDTGLILGITEAAQDTSFQAMAQRQLAAVKVILQDPAVQTVGHNIGPGGSTAAPNQGRMFIALKPRDQRDASADQVIARLDQKLARVEGIGVFLQPAQDITIGGRLNKTQFQYTLTDADNNELQLWASRFVDEFRKLPQVADVATDQEAAGPLLNVTVNRDVASSFGILPSTIDNTLDDAFGQRIASTIYSTLNQYRVILEVAPQYQASPDTLSRIYVSSSAGQQVPLSTLVNSSTTTAPLVINHQSLFPSVTISFNLKPGASLGDAVAAINDFAQRSGKPLSLTGTFQGNANAFASSLSGEPILILAALIVIYIILGVLYESVVHPITILSTLPSAGIGALLLLMAVHMDMSVIAMLGIILLIGIVKKNGIMLVDFALHAEKEEHLSSEQSIYRACTLRFRPILMTTMAALLGGVPLMLGTGTGSEIRQPLGYTIVGGLLLSQLLTLYTTPVVYLYLDRLAAWLGRRRGKGAPELVPAE